MFVYAVLNEEAQFLFYLSRARVSEYQTDTALLFDLFLQMWSVFIFHNSFVPVNPVIPIFLAGLQ
jgi:hypothetical protein